MRPTKSKSGDDETSEKSRPSSTAVRSLCNQLHLFIYLFIINQADDLKWVEENLPTTAVDA